ncbi:MAG: hypothetical protein U5J96_18540 [Ignavibacteriaceae bacterium]|nr:hypothetical protein [Ignavibacteriaceae bacterium]
MLIEIILIQRFTLYFGNVIYAAALVVCLMLVSSGFGSLVSQKITPKPYRIFLIVSFIIISFIIYALFLSGWIRTTIGFSLTDKNCFIISVDRTAGIFYGNAIPAWIEIAFILK